MVNAYVTSSGEWDWANLEPLFPHKVLLRLATIKINTEKDVEDTLSWCQAKSGIFSTKSAFNMLSPSMEGPIDPALSILWKMKIPNRIQFHNWLAYKGKLLTNVQRCHKHLIDYDICSSCSSSSESILHAARDCCYSLEVWKALRADYFMPNFFTASHRECGR